MSTANRIYNKGNTVNNSQTCNIQLSLEQTILLYDALTDMIIDWRAEVKRRLKDKEEVGGLGRNLERLEDARDGVSSVLRRHGIMRGGK